MVHGEHSNASHELQPDLPYKMVAFYRDHNTSFAYVVAERAEGVFVDDELELQLATFVTGNYFTDLGVNPAEGRLLDEGDARAVSEPVAVLSHQFWRRQFAGDPASWWLYIRFWRAFSL